MSAPERSRSYLELDSDKLRASTPAEFRELLDHIRTRAGLTPSQIAVKTTIPRSQAYNLVAATRTTLPSKPEQVREFVEACGLAPVQVGLVMTLYAKLDEQAREATDRALSLADKAAATDTMRQGRILNNFYSEVAVPGSIFGASSQKSSYRDDDSTYRRKRTSSDLLFLVLDSEDRTRRALRLMLPITLAIVAIVAILVAWAILQPDRADMIAGILVVGILLPITSRLGRVIRIHR